MLKVGTKVIAVNAHWSAAVVRKGNIGYIEKVDFEDYTEDELGYLVNFPTVGTYWLRSKDVEAC